MVEPVKRGGSLVLVAMLLATLVIPSSAFADAPAGAGAEADLDAPAAAMPMAVAQQTWLAQAVTSATLGPPRSLVPSDGRLHRVNIGGRRIAIWCEGSGSPTVVLEHGMGYGVDSDSWEDVQEGVARETRVCRYDRAYVGESDDARAGRSMPDLAEDLVDLMTAARIPGPYILVGHSFGGLSVRYFALLHPTSVAGIVLVDGSPRGAIINLDLGSERLNRTRVLSQLNQLKSLGRIPLVVITRGIGLSPAWRAAQLAMVKLSTSGRQVIAYGSDHWIQLRQPSLVIRQILTVVHTVRRNW
jgi:pimeloyl-ACP methyl ester carboxylesterase